MADIRRDLEEFRDQLGDGSIQRAYAGILGFMSALRTRYLRDGDAAAVSSLYQGQFDMTYFALFPPALKARDLKLAIVFDYAAFRFEIWLVARNRRVQAEYWRRLREGGWTGCPLVDPAPGVDAIVRCDVANGLELDDPDTLTSRVEQAASALLADLERFLAAHDARGMA